MLFSVKHTSGKGIRDSTYIWKETRIYLSRLWPSVHQSVLGGLTLRIVKICWDSHYSVLHFLDSVATSLLLFSSGGKGVQRMELEKNKAWWVTCDTKFIRVALQEVITVMCAFLMDSPTRQWKKLAFKSHFTRENPPVLLSFIIGKCTQRWTQKNLKNHECKTTPAPSTNGFLTKSVAFKLKNIDKYFDDHLWNFKLEVVKRCIWRDSWIP